MQIQENHLQNLANQVINRLSRSMSQKTVLFHEDFQNIELRGSTDKDIVYLSRRKNLIIGSLNKQVSYEFILNTMVSVCNRNNVKVVKYAEGTLDAVDIQLQSALKSMHEYLLGCGDMAKVKKLNQVVFHASEARFLLKSARKKGPS